MSRRRLFSEEKEKLEKLAEDLNDLQTGEQNTLEILPEFDFASLHFLMQGKNKWAIESERISSVYLERDVGSRAYILTIHEGMGKTHISLNLKGDRWEVVPSSNRGERYCLGAKLKNSTDSTILLEQTY